MNDQNNSFGYQPPQPQQPQAQPQQPPYAQPQPQAQPQQPPYAQPQPQAQPQQPPYAQPQPQAQPQQTPYEQPQPQAQPQQPPYEQPQPQAQPQQPPYTQPQQGFNQAQFQGVGGVMVQDAPKKKSKAGIIIGVIAGIFIIAIIAAMFSGSPEKKFYGSWKASIDYTDSVKEKIGTYSSSVSKDFKFEIALDFTFNDDNTYKYSLNEESFDKSKQMLVDEFTVIMKNELKTTLGSTYTDAEIETQFKEYYGKSIKEYTEDLFKDFTYDSVKSTMTGEGKFKVKDNKLFLSDALNHDVDETTYDIFEEKSSTEIVLLEEYEKNVKTSDSGNIFPMTLIKQK